MDKTNFGKYGLIGAVVSAVGLGIGLIVSGCRVRKLKKQVEEEQAKLVIGSFVDMVNEAKIKNLEEEIQELKSNCKEKES